MASTATKWILGCGAGCLLIVALGVAIIAAGVWQVKKVVNRFEETEAVHQRVREQLGDVDDYVPAADGALRAERVEAFLQVRAAFATAREETERTLVLLGEAERGERDWSAGRLVEVVGAGAGLLGQIADFYTARSEAMLEVGMGPGEYAYTYVVAYYAFLDHSPEDGPAFQLIGDDGRERGWRIESGVEDRRRDEIVRQLHRAIVPMLRRQLTSVPPGEASQRWRDRLAAEIAALEADPDRTPWRDGLPEPIAASFEPFRAALESSYSQLCNPLELQHP